MILVRNIQRWWAYRQRMRHWRRFYRSQIGVRWW